jgi:hypothetical protein
VEQEEMVIARQWCGKFLSAATNKHAIIEELLEAVFLYGPHQGYIARTNGKS